MSMNIFPCLRKILHSGEFYSFLPEISGEWQKKAPAASGSRGGGQPKYFSRKGTLST